MEVHPPEHAIHNWRDFFIHIGTITIGLLIAIALEQTVELIHHRHQRHTVERNLEREFDQNRAVLLENERQLASSRNDINNLARVLASPLTPEAAAHVIWPHWHWSDFSSTAWDTARSSDVTSLIPFDDLEQSSGVYTQQGIVNRQAAVYIRDIYDIDAPLIANRSFSQLTPEEKARLQVTLERASTDLAYLQDLCRSLDTVYNAAASNLSRSKEQPAS